MSYSEDNKLQGDIRSVFKPDQERWDRNELEVISEINKQYLQKTEKADEYFDLLKKKLDTQGLSMLPHQKSLEVIIHDARKFLLEFIDILSNDHNPYQYVVSSQENIFSSSIWDNRISPISFL